MLSCVEFGPERYAPSLFCMSFHISPLFLAKMASPSGSLSNLPSPFRILLNATLYPSLLRIDIEGYCSSTVIPFMYSKSES